MPAQNDLFDQIMSAISTTAEWDKIQRTDLAIKQSEKELHVVIDPLKQICRLPDLGKLEDVVLSHYIAMTDAAMLYGARVVICMLAATGTIGPAITAPPLSAGKKGA